MSKKDLLYRGYRTFVDYFFDLMVKSRSGPEAPQDMYLELGKVERRQCIMYLVDQAEEKDKDAFTAMRAIAMVL